MLTFNASPLCLPPVVSSRWKPALQDSTELKKKNKTKQNKNKQTNKLGENFENSKHFRDKQTGRSPDADVLMHLVDPARARTPSTPPTTRGGLLPTRHTGKKEELQQPLASRSKPPFYSGPTTARGRLHSNLQTFTLCLAPVERSTRIPCSGLALSISCTLPMSTPPLPGTPRPVR